MIDIGKFYLFTPPYSETEHFVEVTGFTTRDTSPGNLPDTPKSSVQYVHFKHAHADVEGSAERTTFQKRAQELNLEVINRVLAGISSEIERLEENREKFIQIREVIHARRGDKKPQSNGQSVQELVSDAPGLEADVEQESQSKTKRVITDDE